MRVKIYGAVYAIVQRVDVSLPAQCQKEALLSLPNMTGERDSRPPHGMENISGHSQLNCLRKLEGISQVSESLVFMDFEITWSQGEGLNKVSITHTVEHFTSWAAY